jgi:probable HAF family extracellular repeat protein
MVQEVIIYTIGKPLIGLSSIWRADRWGVGMHRGVHVGAAAVIAAGLMAVAPSRAAEGTVRQPGPEVPRATATVLPSLPGTSAVVHDVNDQGEAVGESGGRPVLWRDGSPVTLAPERGVATEVNDRGDVLVEGDGVYHWRAGRVTRIPGATDAVDMNERGQVLLGSPPGVWDADTAQLTPISGPPGLLMNVYGISDGGHVAGLVYGGTAYDTGTFVWRDGTMTRLGRLAPTQVLDFAAAANASGEVVGLEGDDGLGVIWRDGLTTPLGLRPLAINDGGQVVGTRDLASGRRAAVWDDGVLTDLGSLGAGGRAVGINELGQVIGYHRYTDGLHYFVWTKGWRVDLGRVADTGVAISINDRGQVAVTSADRGAVVWQIDDSGVEPPAEADGRCVLANNWAHVRDGRAVSYLWWAWAAGTSQYLGLVTDTTSLRRSPAGSWQMVDAC